MIHRLPRWVWAGGCVLSFVAGMVNVVGLLSFVHLPVTHLTATTSRLAFSLTEANKSVALSMAGLIGAFFGGAMFSGWLINSSALALGRRYEVALIAEATVLGAAMFLLHWHDVLGIGLCCFACGLQNGMASTFSGAILRTTHMTGLFTDLGVHAGQIVRGQRPDWRRLCLFVGIISGFAAGGVLAAIVFPRWQEQTLLIPVAIILGAAIIYRRVRLRSVRSDREAVTIQKSEGP